MRAAQRLGVLRRAGHLAHAASSPRLADVGDQNIDGSGSPRSSGAPRSGMRSDLRRVSQMRALIDPHILALADEAELAGFEHLHEVSSSQIFWRDPHAPALNLDNMPATERYSYRHGASDPRVTIR